jgi:hypothetical protein
MVLTAQWRRRRPLPAGWLAGGAWGASKAMGQREGCLPYQMHYMYGGMCGGTL